MKSMINIHNKQILKSPELSEERKCNCPKTKPNCPLDGHCLIKNIVYKATVTSDATPSKQYIGLTSRTFKERLGSHTQSFKNKDLSHSTEVSKYLWRPQERNEKYSIKGHCSTRHPLQPSHQTLQFVPSRDISHHESSKNHHTQ